MEPNYGFGQQQLSTLGQKNFFFRFFFLFFFCTITQIYKRIAHSLWLAHSLWHLDLPKSQYIVLRLYNEYKLIVSLYSAPNLAAAQCSKGILLLTWLDPIWWKIAKVPSRKGQSNGFRKVSSYFIKHFWFSKY